MSARPIWLWRLALGRRGRPWERACCRRPARGKRSSGRRRGDARWLLRWSSYAKEGAPAAPTGVGGSPISTCWRQPVNIAFFLVAMAALAFAWVLLVVILRAVMWVVLWVALDVVWLECMLEAARAVPMPTMLRARISAPTSRSIRERTLPSFLLGVSATVAPAVSDLRLIKALLTDPWVPDSPDVTAR